MTENTARSARRSRVPGATRNSSARSSTALNAESLLLPPSLALHPSSSRFSLNEQFAMTRHDYEFGFDDSSSVLETATTVSEAVVEHHDDEDTVVIGAIDDPDNALSALRQVGDRDCYDLLCVPQNASADDIRRAYYRLFLLLFPDLHPLKLRDAAALCFNAVQNAFETLIEPGVRNTYDLDNATSRQRTAGAYEGYRRQLRALWYSELLGYHLSRYGVGDGDHTYLDFEFIRDYVPGLVKGLLGPSVPQEPALRPLAFAVGECFTATLPTVGDKLDWLLHNTPTLLELVRRRGTKPNAGSEVDVAEEVHLPASRDISRTSLTVRGSVRGLLSSPFPTQIPCHFVDPHQPSIYDVIPVIQRLIHLLVPGSQIQPALSLKLQHQLVPPANVQGELRKRSIEDSEEEGTVLELESEITPDPALAARISRQVILPYDNKPSMLQVAAKAPFRLLGLARVGVAVQRPVLAGLFQCRVETGSWSWISTPPNHSSGSYWSRLQHLLLLADTATDTSPKVEFTYKIRGFLRPSLTCYPIHALEGGLRDTDWSMDHDARETTTLSVTAEPHCFGHAVKYARDVGFPTPESWTLVSLSHPRSWGTKRNPDGAIRLEVEISTNTLWTGYMAMRCLKRLGRRSKVGFEAGIGQYGLYLSLYWSRPGRSIRIPFLLGLEHAVARSPLVSFAIAAPIFGMLAWGLTKNSPFQSGIKSLKSPVTKMEAERHEQRHKEADEIRYLLATNVQSNQDAERVKGGLVILSAYYVVKALGAEKTSTDDLVVDVTVAVAALVDKGKLYVPSDVCKNNLLGFWDPDPNAQKILRVCYLFQGKEATVEVGEEAELRLPPIS